MREEKTSNTSVLQETMLTEPYYEKWQKLQDSHTTRDPRFAEDWGVHRKFLLFPQHLPDLYLPTKQSFNQTLRESTDTGLAARWISLFQHGYNLS